MKEAHKCRDGRIRPYPTVFCSMCMGEGIDLMLNDFKVGPATNEPCPQCGTPATCQHATDDAGKARHLWTCAACGDTVAWVGYDCEVCQKVSTDDPRLRAAGG